jgi:hypothetical protein
MALDLLWPQIRSHLELIKWALVARLLPTGLEAYHQTGCGLDDQLRTRRMDL